uniref:Actin-related protein 2/3 complex subunit 5 n=1 Tax=Blastobotrys adeninivorans TaxID=409370 RepID=A0A060TF04_BLAAD
MSVDFRKVDVDALDPDKVVSPEELVPPLPPVDPQEIEQRGQLIRQQLSKGDYIGALQVALDNPPYGGDERTKETNLRNVLEVLTTIKSSDITQIVDQLTPEDQNVLIKYLYKGMGSPLGQSHGNGGILLSWFEKTVDITGQGAIIRYIADRRTV